MSEKQQQLLALRRNFISGQADRRTMEIKRHIRQDTQNNKKSNRVSSYINNVGQYESDKITEEDVQCSIMESILQIFRGCHRDSYKITMFLRGIILENVHDILEEVSLVCGAHTSQSLIIYLYDPISLKEQFHRLGQVDIGITQLFAVEELQRKNELSKRQQSMEEDSFVQNVNDSFRSSDRESSAAKITIKEDYIGGVHFPFGDEIDSSTTELSLNQLRVIAMGKILYERTLQKIPGNSEKAIAETIGKFANYVMLFGNVPSTEEITND